MRDSLEKLCNQFIEARDVIKDTYMCLAAIWIQRLCRERSLYS